MSRSFRRCFEWNSYFLAEVVVIIIGLCLLGGALVAVCYGIIVETLLFPIPYEESHMRMYLILAATLLALILVFWRGVIGYFSKYALDTEGFVVKKPFAVTRKYLWTDIYKIDVGTVSVNKKHFRVIRVFFTQPSNSLDKWVRQIGTYLSKPNSIQLISHTDAGFNEIMNYYQN